MSINIFIFYCSWRKKVGNVNHLFLFVIFVLIDQNSDKCCIFNKILKWYQFSLAMKISIRDIWTMCDKLNLGYIDLFC